MKNLAAGFTAAAIAGSLLLAGSGAAYAGPPVANPVPVTTISAGTATVETDPVDTPDLVDPRQDHNAINCRFNKTEQDREKYCKALETKKMTETAKNCLMRMGVGGAAALVVGKVNKKAAREIAVNVVGAGASGCLTALLT
ncbi:hypothetical protein [Streptomyces sp. LS1784]|uniref:hypothetical protein n=1 Tax=Streptomyces sp. LS1784 TaxID=2851533 RepID=UPI001CC94581|nr:hypothetical protein [Streptomyces sp. LS1784]